MKHAGKWCFEMAVVTPTGEHKALATYARPDDNDDAVRKQLSDIAEAAYDEWYLQKPDSA